MKLLENIKKWFNDKTSKDKLDFCKYEEEQFPKVDINDIRYKIRCVLASDNIRSEVYENPKVILFLRKHKRYCGWSGEFAAIVDEFIGVRIAIELSIKEVRFYGLSNSTIMNLKKLFDSFIEYKDFTFHVNKYEEVVKFYS